MYGISLFCTVNILLVFLILLYLVFNKAARSVAFVKHFYSFKTLRSVKDTACHVCIIFFIHAIWVEIELRHIFQIIIDVRGAYVTPEFNKELQCNVGNMWEKFTLYLHALKTA